jgi:hypothetical protein
MKSNGPQLAGEAIVPLVASDQNGTYDFQEPTAVDIPRWRDSAVAIHVASRRWPGVFALRAARSPW